MATPTSSLATAFARAREAGRTALIPYVMAGHPSHEEAIDIVVALADAGADAIEIGLPFSDPLADGPTIQRAATASLAAGTTMATCLDAVRVVRARGVGVPLVLMGYANPMLRYGLERFCADAAAAGASALIVPDLPPEEAGDLRAAADRAGLDVVLLVAPTTPDERIAHIASLGSGFLYCVSVTGITGARAGLSSELPGFLTRVRAHAGDLPIAVGFGISTAEHVREVGVHADGAVVGSALIDRIDAAPPGARAEAAAIFLRGLLGP